MSDEQAVLTDISDGVMTITINRAQAKNAVNLAVAKGIAAAIDELDANDDIRVGILTGAGGTFCAGMDLKAFVTGELPVVEGKGFGGITEAPPTKPLIGAVEGFALAGGFELALVCDLLVVASDASFGIPEAKRGLVAAAGGLVRLPRQIPPRLAMELALTGDFITAQRAYEMGLINRIVDKGEALDGAMALARRVVANGPLAIAASKRVIVEQAGWPDSEIFERQRAITDPIFSSEDAVEGSRAFAEKREPNWQGR
ncbi:MAG: enoyl-CoA hydratase [Salinisphaeraceae bacterium]|jgi:enoyl-CoA hydratase|nr:enoyl-CoA hydratase [Salinisphaeraceae bacterium]